MATSPQAANSAAEVSHQLQWMSDQCELHMTLICEQVRQELKKQIALPGKSVLVRMIEETFDVTVSKR